MRHCIVSTAFLAALALVWGLPSPCQAQFVPYGGYYGGWGAYPYDIAMGQRFDNNRELQAQGAAQATAAHQRINDLLIAQGEARTQNQLAETQAARNWWLNYQERQMDRRAMMVASAGAAAPAPAAPAPPPESLGAPANEPPPPDVIRWPTVLREERFGLQRQRVEGPFRRAAAGGEPVSAEEYRDMAKAADTMKSMLAESAASLEPTEYAAVVKFVDQLAAESLARYRQKILVNPEPAPTPPAPAPTPPAPAPTSPALAPTPPAPAPGK